MARNANVIDNNSSNNHKNNQNNKNEQQSSKPWRILALVISLLCCTAAAATLPVAAATVVDPSAQPLVADATLAVVANGDSDGGGGGVADADADSSVIVSKRSAEIVQLPHVFRHQEHYSHRIEQVVNDMKRTSELQQQLSGKYSNSTVGVRDRSVENNNNNNNNNNFLHYDSHLQPRMPDHLRHHHNQKHRSSLTPVSAWERYMLPPLRHQRHQLNAAAASADTSRFLVTTAAPTLPLATLAATEGALVEDGSVAEVLTAAVTNEHANTYAAINYVAVNGSSAQQQLKKKPQRYFDRDGLYQSPYLWTTRGPKQRGNAENDWKAKDFTDILHLSARKQTDSQRISLNLNADSAAGPHGAQSNGEDVIVSENYDSEITTDGMVNDDSSGSSVYDDDDGDEEDDYSYEDSAAAAEEAIGNANVNAHTFPAAHNNMYDREQRAAVKRYTNPFNDLRLPPKKRDYPQPYPASRRRSASARGGNDGAANTYADTDDNSDGEFSSEKWQRIEQKHHRKQREHRREMLALRARPEPAATATPLIVSQSAVGATTVKQQRLNDDATWLITLERI
ncbi:unnamed protein product [Ceratitis capitata]|uniref:(Mediterranean fruit fly) hypothetical protein n=1 Tax=Ceratitis capitata TaxID=7213 RepID=A0A811UP13_CERCA|nr:unnamed protein product [Ceratitis capitata]